MSVTEVQVPLPDPPTGIALVLTEHVYNPENGHYEPPLRARPQNASIPSGTLVAPNPLLAVVAGTPIWIYHIVLANVSGAAETCVLAETGGGNTYTVEVPANQTVIVTSTPDAPLFMSRAAGAFMFGSDVAASVVITITYVTK